MWKAPDGTYLANRTAKKKPSTAKKKPSTAKNIHLVYREANLCGIRANFEIGRALASSGSYFYIGGRQLLLYMYSGSYVPATSLGYAERANYFQYQNIPARRTVSSETNHQVPQVLPVWIATQAHSNQLTSRQLTD